MTACDRLHERVCIGCVCQRVSLVCTSAGDSRPACLKVTGGITEVMLLAMKGKPGRGGRGSVVCWALPGRWAAARLLSLLFHMHKAASPVLPGQRNGVTIAPVLEETPREGSHLPPALSSSLALQDPVSTELLFKINRALTLCQALSITSCGPHTAIVPCIR